MYQAMPHDGWPANQTRNKFKISVETFFENEKISRSNIQKLEDEITSDGRVSLFAASRSDSGRELSLSLDDGGFPRFDRFLRGRRGR